MKALAKTAACAGHVSGKTMIHRQPDQSASDLRLQIDLILPQKDIDRSDGIQQHSPGPKPIAGRRGS